jgi:hypothetical protein
MIAQKVSMLSLSSRAFKSFRHPHTNTSLTLLDNVDCCSPTLYFHMCNDAKKKKSIAHSLFHVPSPPIISFSIFDCLAPPPHVAATVVRTTLHLKTSLHFNPPHTNEGHRSLQFQCAVVASHFQQNQDIPVRLHYTPFHIS